MVFLLTTCQKTLDTQNLKVYNNVYNQDVKHYTTESLDDAISSLPFELKLPKKIPKEFNQFQPLFITDWDSHKEGKDIAIEIRATSEKEENNLSIHARNFDMSILNSFKQDGDKLTLENKQDVYINTFYNDDHHTSNISWINKDIFYSIEYSGMNLVEDEIKKTLLDLVI